ncbi:MAG: hypothetical protein H6Q41_4059 [Deltaproteobacteria bacterium]|nr:hypothetical protein [Deltaproteobacteria bacterium]
MRLNRGTSWSCCKGRLVSYAALLNNNTPVCRKDKPCNDKIHRNPLGTETRALSQQGSFIAPEFCGIAFPVRGLFPFWLEQEKPCRSRPEDQEDDREDSFPA